MIKAILFDKDGTLFDFNATWGAFAQLMITQEAGGDATLEERLATVLGFDMAEGQFRQASIVIAETVEVVAEAIMPVVGESDKAALMARLKVGSMQVPQIEPTPLRPLLTQLRSMGLVLGVATNDSESSARHGLAHVLEQFQFIAGFDSGYGGKPASGQMFGFCAAVDIAPEHCVMVGDSLHDLHAGRVAGMRCVGVLTGPALREELAPHADVVLGSIAELPAWIASQNADQD